MNNVYLLIEHLKYLFDQKIAGKKCSSTNLNKT